jgi:hypothetical protein
MSFSADNRNSTANPILLKIKVVGNGVGRSMSDCGTGCAGVGVDESGTGRTWSFGGALGPERPWGRHPASHHTF